MKSGSVVWAWLRIDLRRRWRSLAVLTLLVAVASAVVMGSLAGARRGASAMSRLQARTLPATSAVLANTAGFDWSKVRALPEVSALTTFVVDYGFQFEGVPIEDGEFPPADDQTMRTIEKPVIYQGRLFDPRRVDEAVVTRQFVAHTHKGVGATVVLDLPSAGQLQSQVEGPTGVPFVGPHIKVRIVGVIGSVWFSDGPGATGTIVMSPAVVARYPANTIGNQADPNNLAFINALVRLRGGEAAIPQLRTDLARLTGRSDIDVWDLPAQARDIQHGIAFEARCLAAFALAAFAAALFLIGQAIARYAAATVAELQTMRALGMTPTQAIAAAAAGPAISGVLGALLGALGAYLISYWTPIGTASFLEPAPGLSFDWVVLGPAIAVTVVLVAGGAAAAAWLAVGAARRGAPIRRSAIAAGAARAGFPVPIVVGTRFALESGRGRTAVPVRPALVGAVAGVLGIVAAFTFAHGVTNASDTPERFGQTFQLASYFGVNGQNFGPTPALLSALTADKNVTGVDDARSAVATGAGSSDSVTMYAYGAGQKPLQVVVTSGRMPAAADEVLLAPRSLTALKTKVGEHVTLKGNKHPVSYLVTGSGFVPEGPHNAYADGGWVSQAGYDRLFSGFKFHFVLVAMAPTARTAAAAGALSTDIAKIDPALKGVQFQPPQPPDEIAQLRQVRVLPILLGAFLALLAVGAVGHALATAVRRRSHDLAVLRALGLTQRQCRAITFTQATVVAVIGLIFGVPLGLAIGRLVWRGGSRLHPDPVRPAAGILGAGARRTGRSRDINNAGCVAGTSRRAAARRPDPEGGIAMDATAIASVVLGAAWLMVGLVAFGRRSSPLAVTCLTVAATQFAAAAWNPLAPLVIAAWLGYALAIPRGSIDTSPRRVAAALGLALALVWSVVLGAAGDAAGPGLFIGAAIVAVAAAVLAVGLRYRQAGPDDRRTLQWVTAGGVLVVGSVVVLLSLHAMTGTPEMPRIWVTYSLLFIPLAQLLALVVAETRAAAYALTESIAVAGLAALVAVVYLVIVVGIHGPPDSHEHAVLLASLIAALVVAVLALPVRRRLVGLAEALIGNRDPSTDEVATAFSARMSRSVPMDELLLQLAESLRATVPGATAEIWTGADGTLTRAVSVPSAPPARLLLADRERVVIGQARIGGPGWATVWLPNLLASNDSPNPKSDDVVAGDVRFVPVAHLGELLGLIVVRRPADAPEFSEDDERPLVELARQLGLALHNVRLDSALQASLAELAQRNEELQASRLRIVTAADDSRRAIERNLHDGAQQHLVALAVKLGLAAAIAEDGDTETVRTLVSDLRADVQTTIGELRELAHGIYPPLLRDRGLTEALRTAATRSPLPCSVEVDVPGRYPEQIEATIYFCCLEAMQNAGKYAGDGAQLCVRVTAADELLCVEVSDDGAGFDATAGAHGQGFINMRDRLGAIGADLVVDSSPGHGTRVSTQIPVEDGLRVLGE